MPDPLLRIEGLHAGYGDIRVLWDLHLEVPANEITCVVGSNGAGKTTLLRTVSGLIKSSEGQIAFEGRSLIGCRPDEILALGLVHVPEGRRLFRGLSVRDNLLLGSYLRRDKREVERDLAFVHALFPILEERAEQDATTLSGGEQQMCAIARGLMARPKLLLIDELSLGLAPKMVEHLSAALLEINRSNVTILLVEQDIVTAFELAKHACIMEMGHVTRQGQTTELIQDASLRSAYLGM